MFGMWDAIYAFLARMIGNRTDAADANGSLHAKVSQLQNSVNAIPTIPATRFEGKHSNLVCSITGSNTSSTVVNISGSGFLTGIAQYCLASSGGYLTIKIDGVTVLNDMPLVSSSSGNFSLPCFLRFNTSLVVQHRTGSSTTGSLYTTVSYLTD